MPATIDSLPVCEVRVDAGSVGGPLELWRHSVGHGGIHPRPLSLRVQRGLRKLSPRLVRVFLQEFFRPCPAPGQFDWQRLDDYLDSFAATGARVVAAITLKPAALFPIADQRVWRPSSVEAWQALIRALVDRYSVRRSLVTHWEIGNETDIGEAGGCPYLIPDPESYVEYYRMTVQPIVEAFPAARVGGPAACWVENEPLPGLVERCKASGLPLHFISWHLYSDDPERHAAGVEKGRALTAGWPGERPELMVTEWSKSFDPVSVEEMAFEPRRAALAAAAILQYLDARADWTFYYHTWDQLMDPAEFRGFFSQEGLRGYVRHWNEVPHRFGLFGLGEEVRPQYFVFQLMARMGPEQCAAQCDESGIRVLAARQAASTSVLLVNVNPEEAADRVVTVRFDGLQPGAKRLTVWRIDHDRRWSEPMLELMPLEQRPVVTNVEFYCQALLPANTVALVELRDVAL